MYAATHMHETMSKRMHKGERMAKSVAATTRDKALDLAVNLVDFQKATFDNTAKVVGSIQEQTEKMLLDVIEKSAWMPKEAKKAVSEWVRLAKHSRAEFTKTMDKSFVLMNTYLKRMHDGEVAHKADVKSAVKVKRAKRRAHHAKAAK